MSSTPDSALAEALHTYMDPQSKATKRWEAMRFLVTNGVELPELPPDPERPRKERKRNPPVQGNPTRETEARLREEARRAKLICLDEVEPEEYEWLWPGRFPMRTVSLIAGDGGAGKSTLTGALATTITTGGCWPDLPGEHTEKGRVIFLTAEENLATDVRPRMNRFGADCRKIHVIQAIDDGRGSERRFSLIRDVPVLGRAVAELGNVKLIIIDPVGSYLTGSDSHNDSEVQQALNPLFELAESHHLAVLLIAHLTKQSSADIQSRIQGAAAFVNKSRMVWFYSPDPRNHTRRLLSFIKGNPVDKITTGLSVGFTGGVLAWDPEPVMMSAKQVNRKLFDALQRGEEAGQRGPKPEKTRAIMDLIEARLKGAPKPVKLADIIDQAEDDLGASRSAVHRALRKLNGHVHETVGANQTKLLTWNPGLKLKADDE